MLNILITFTLYLLLLLFLFIIIIIYYYYYYYYSTIIIIIQLLYQCTVCFYKNYIHFFEFRDFNIKWFLNDSLYFRGRIQSRDLGI